MDFLIGAIFVILIISKIGNIMVDVQSDWNKSTQHKRDREIVNAIRELNDKE